MTDLLGRPEKTVRALIAQLLESRRDYELSGGKRKRASVLTEIDRLRPLVEDHARRIGFSQPPEPARADETAWAYEPYSAWASELLGYTMAGAEQRSLAVSRLAALVSPTQGALLREGQNDEAVKAAALALEQTLQALTDLPLTGEALLERALAAPEQHSQTVDLRCGGTPSDERAYRDGVRRLLAGALAAFRDSHPHGGRTPVETLEGYARVFILSYLRHVLLQGGPIGGADGRGHGN